MKSVNIEYIKKNDMCCSCGICVGVCPKECIKMTINDKSLLVPQIDIKDCIECGLCQRVCPGLLTITNNLTQDKFDLTMKEQIKCKQAYIGNIKDAEKLQNATSGGICSELIDTLLTQKIFDSAFVCDSHCFTDYAKANRYVKFEKSISKSRYIPVSHENTIKYILNNKQEKIILVGTSCAITGFRKVIDEYHLEKNNYLLLGLFCDKMMNYNVWNYFEKTNSIHDKLKALYFRTKEISGWPGDMMLKYDGFSNSVSKKIRMVAKTYFTNERCLYCVDKLNHQADIALGDNYTGILMEDIGSSCIIIKTDIGKKAFDQILNKCNLTEIDMSIIAQSQRLKNKKDNHIFLNIKYKFLNDKKNKISILKKIKYLFKITKIRIGNMGAKAPMIFKGVIWFESRIK